MSRKTLQALTLPNGEGWASVVKKGDVLRIAEIEGKQVADVAIWNATDYKERYSVGMTLTYNMIEGIGNIKRLTKLYSQPSRNNVLLTVIDDTVQVHYCVNGGMCNPMAYSIRGVKGYHNNCLDIIARAIRPYGLTPEVSDIFNVFMNVDIDEKGVFVIKPPVSKKGDYIDLRAEMDCLVAVSCCPMDALPVNDWQPKALGIEVWRP